MKKVLSFIPVLFAVLYISACCSCGSVDDNVVKGKIIVIGSEAYSKLAVKLDNDKVYVLECSGKLQEELNKNQGNLYAIKFSSSKMELNLPVLVVESATPIIDEKLK